MENGMKEEIGVADEMTWSVLDRAHAVRAIAFGLFMASPCILEGESIKYTMFSIKFWIVC